MTHNTSVSPSPDHFEGALTPLPRTLLTLRPDQLELRWAECRAPLIDNESRLVNL
jgi:hypothetical protein